MLLDRCFAIITLCFAMSSTIAEVVADQCVQVDCDCQAFVDEKWRSECQAREHVVIKECRAGSGTVQSYCGLHGPGAFPVATSIQGAGEAHNFESGSNFALKQVKTQAWSLDETVRTFRAALKNTEYGKAMQLATLIESDAKKLFKLQKQAVAALRREGNTRDARAAAAEYAHSESKNGAALAKLSEQLWQKIATSAEWKEQRASKILSFKTARTAATVYEFAGDLYADADASAKAADLWQQSAAIAQKLIGWESITENNPKHIRFYQAQASARWYRATFHWLQDQNLQQVAQSTAQARSHSAETGENVATAQVDHLHSVDKGDMRAIKRGQ